MMRSRTMVLGVALLAAACTMKGGDLDTNNRYTFPNSNVAPLGYVSAEVTKTDFFWSSGADREMRDQVLRAALAQKHADMIIDYKWTTEVTAYPLFITTTRLRLDGTAASADLGGQDVNAPAFKIPR